MIKSIKTFGLFMVLLSMAQACAVVINMEELYNPSLQQTVILMGDLHATASEVDEWQYNALFNAAKKHSARVIIEGSSDNNSWGDQRVLPRFAHSCWIARMPLSNIEFRKEVDNLMFLAKHANNCKQMDEIKSFFEKNISKADIFDSFIKMGIESARVRIEIVEFIRTIKALPKKNMVEKEMLFFIEDVLRRHDQLSDEIKAVFQYDAACTLTTKERAVDAMINDFFFEYEGHVYTRFDGAYWKAFRLQSIFLDLKVIKQMYAHRNERVLFVYTGQAHTQSISCILRAIGFDLKFQNSNDPEVGRLMKGLHRTKELDALYKSEAMAPCYINIEEFFASCSTLPQPEVSNSSRIYKLLIGGGVVAIGAWVAYALFSKKNALIATGASAVVGSTFRPYISVASRVPAPTKLESSNKILYAKTFLASSFFAMVAFLAYDKFGSKGA